MSLEGGDGGEPASDSTPVELRQICPKTIITFSFRDH